jgi:hypothetical protein
MQIAALRAKQEAAWNKLQSKAGVGFKAGERIERRRVTLPKAPA